MYDSFFCSLEYFIQDQDTFYLVTKFLSQKPKFCKIRCTIQDIFYRFKVSIPTVSHVFLNMVDIINAKLKPLICWPEKDEFRDLCP